MAKRRGQKPSLTLTQLTRLRIIQAQFGVGSDEEEEFYESVRSKRTEGKERKKGRKVQSHARDRVTLQREHQRTFYLRHKDDETYKAKRKALAHRYWLAKKEDVDFKKRRSDYRKAYRDNNEYRKAHREYMRAYRKKKKEKEDGRQGTIQEVV